MSDLKKTDDILAALDRISNLEEQLASLKSETAQACRDQLPPSAKTSDVWVRDSSSPPRMTLKEILERATPDTWALVAMLGRIAQAIETLER